jgi:oligoribonuclease
MPPADRIVWVDCEMTGLSLDNDALIEVAAVVTDSELNILTADGSTEPGIDVLIAPSTQALDQMNDYVRNMHTTSGLLDELADPTKTLSMTEAEDAILTYIRQFVCEPRKAPLGGNSVGTDKMFLIRDMPTLVDHLHYRIIDVSTIKELTRRWYPRVYYASPDKQGGHRALADILESIDELRYYRQTLFVPQPGPSSDQARNIAATIHATTANHTT